MNSLSGSLGILQRNIPICKHYLKFASIFLRASKCRFFGTKSKPTNGSKGIVKMSLVGITTGALLGTGYSIHHMNQPRSHIVNEESIIPTVKEMPNIKPSKKIQIMEDRSRLQLTLFQYQTCPFCCKVRAFLDYYGISYDIVEVDPVLRQSIKWSPYKKVPVLVVKTESEYQPLNDSSMIISALATYLVDEKKNIVEIVKCFPFIDFTDESGKKKTDIMNKYFLMLGNQFQIADDFKEKVGGTISEERKWRKWADDVLVHTLSPNVYRTREEALQAFNWFSEVGEWDKNFPSWERYLIIYVGATAMYLIGKRLKKRHHLKEDVRQSLYDECNYWIKSIREKGKPFMGGDCPNLADLAVYGVLNSIEGCIAFQDLLNNTKIKSWYLDMKSAVTQHKGAQFV